MEPKRTSSQIAWAWTASPRTGALLLVLALAEVIAGLLIRMDTGHWEARRFVFGNWIGGIPLLALLGAVHLVVALWVRWRSGLRDTAGTVAHLAGVALLASVAAGAGLARTTLVEIAPGEALASGAVPGRWELAVVGRDEMGLQAPIVLALSGIAEGTRLAFGEIGTATVAGWQKNGVIGTDLLPIALPSANPALPGFPAIALDFVREGVLPARVALDGNRPSAELGRGMLLVLRRVARPIPFELRFVGFAGATGCVVRVASADSVARSLLIDTHRPLRVREAVVFFAAARTDENGRVLRSVLHVVENPFRDLSWWCLLVVLAAVAAVRFARSTSLALRIGFPAVVIAAVVAGEIPGASPGWLPQGMPWGLLLVLLAVVASHVELERRRAGRFDALGVSSADIFAWGLFAVAASVLLRTLVGMTEGTGGDGWGIASLPLLLWGTMLLAARDRGWIGPRGAALGTIGSVALVPISVLGPPPVAGLPGGCTMAWTLSACAVLEAVFLWWVLLAERCRRCARAARLWRIRYVRSRNPRLRRHGGD